MDYRFLDIGDFSGGGSGSTVKTKRITATQGKVWTHAIQDVLTNPTEEVNPETYETNYVTTIIADTPQRLVLIPGAPLENGDEPSTLLSSLKSYPAGTVAYTAGCTRMFQKDVNGRWIDFDTGEVTYTEPAEDEGGEGGGGERLNDGEIEPPR